MGYKKREEIENLQRKGLCSIIGAITQIISLGTVYSIANFTLYIVSYAHIFDESIQPYHAYFMMPFTILSIFLFGIIGSYVEKKLGMRKTIFAGQAVIICGSVILFFSKNIFLDYLAMFIFGFGLGLAAFIPRKNACAYFPARVGLISAMLETSSTLSSAGLNEIGEFLINREGASASEDDFYPESVAKNFRKYLIFQASLVFLLTLVSLFLIVPYEGKIDEEEGSKLDSSKIERISSPPQDEPKAPINEENKIELLDEDKHNITLHTQVSEFSFTHLSSAFKSSRLWRLAFIEFTGTFCINLLSNTWRIVGNKENIPESYLRHVGTFVFIAQCIASPFWGWMVDCVNYKYILLFTNTLSCILGFSFFFTLKIPILFVIVLLLNGMVDGSFDVSMPPHIAQVFGIKYSVEISNFISSFLALSSFFAALFAFTLEKYIEGSNLTYMIMYFIGGTFSLISLILGIFEDSTKHKYLL